MNIRITRQEWEHLREKTPFNGCPFGTPVVVFPYAAGLTDLGQQMVMGSALVQLRELQRCADGGLAQQHSVCFVRSCQFLGRNS